MVNRDNQGGLVRRPQGTAMWPYGSGGMRRWDPFQEMEEMHRQMDNLFSRAFGISLPQITPMRGTSWGGEDTEPDVDIYENDNEFVIHAFLPGVDQNDINVQATQSSISIWAESRSPFDQQNQGGQAADSGQTGGQQGDGANRGWAPSNQAAGTQANQAGAGQTNQAGAGQSNQWGGGQSNQPHTQHRQSRYSRYNRFQFSYTFPEEIKPDQVRAQFKNGRLELHLPKTQKAQSSGAVRIPITSGMSETGALPSGGTDYANQPTSEAQKKPRTQGQAVVSGTQGAQEGAGREHRRGAEQGGAQPAAQTSTQASPSNTTGSGSGPKTK